MLRMLTIAITIGLCALPAAAQDATTIAQGQKIYTASKCAGCHSIGGAGNKKGPLDGVGAKLTVDQIRQWIVNPAEMTAKTKAERKPAMRSYPNMAESDLNALVAYLQSLKK